MANIVQKYKHAVIATDVVILTVEEGKLKVLLIKMKKKPFAGMWACPGGLVDGSESVDASAKRILREKSGVGNIYLEQLYTFGRVDRDPFGRVVSVAYFALIPEGSRLKVKTTDEYEDISWFDANDLPRLAYDHKEIIECALARLRAKLEYTNIVYSLLPEEFTLTEMQKVYEEILNKKIDKRNFRKKILSLGLVKKTGKTTLGRVSRPAELYKFKQKSMKVVEIL